MTATTTTKKAGQAAGQTSGQATGKKRTITIRLKKSTIACNPVHRATINGLGLKRIRQERTLENTPSVRGMIKSVLHMVDVVAETR